MAYVSNHYVPQWYQRRFIPPDQTERKLYYLDLHPDWFIDGKGVRRRRKALRRLGPRRCFAIDDLYTARFGGSKSREIERRFFGEIDTRGKRAVEFFARFDLDRMDRESFPPEPERVMQDLLRYMSTQKLRTPKGLEWLAGQLMAIDHRTVLKGMLDLQEMHSAIWTECVWQLASASESVTKLLVSDHPVTVYNRACAPTNPHWCKGAHDPDIRLFATHTLFPLDLDRILILTNHGWAVNPYRMPTEPRPYSRLFRGAMFNFLEVQYGRQLCEQEILEINYILKRRAWRYVAAGREDWLYPERHLERTDWRLFGKGHLLMPDPRAVGPAGEWVMAYSDGSYESMDSYGRPPGHPEFGREARGGEQSRRLAQYQEEFARMFGRELRSWCWKERPRAAAA